MDEEEGRTAKLIIDQAIRENRFGERLLYAFATVFVATGVFSLVYGTLRSQGAVAVAGGIGSALFFPAIYQARGIRKENIALRMMEVPLTKANTAQEAAKALNDFFVSVLVKKRDSATAGS
jgi:hypothetical protein